MVPKGINRIVIRDADTSEQLIDADVTIRYERLDQACSHFLPQAFVYEPNDLLRTFPHHLTYPRAIEVTTNKHGEFKIRRKLGIASVQPLWMPALSHTFYSDYAVWISANATGYHPLNLWYYSVNMPKTELRTQEGAAAKIKRGLLELKLKRQKILWPVPL